MIENINIKININIKRGNSDNVKIKNNKGKRISKAINSNY